jgi:hypothetical protein
MIFSPSSPLLCPRIRVMDRLNVPSSSSSSVSVDGTRSRNSSGASWLHPHQQHTVSVARNAYDRQRLVELVSISSSAAPVQTNSHAGLYSSAMMQLSQELSKLPNVAWSKVARLCALCPPMPPVSTHADLAASWKQMTAIFTDDTLLSPIDQSARSDVSMVHWEYSPSRLAVVEANESLDTRVEAVWALARYLVLAARAGESASASHLGRILPVLLRFLLSLPFTSYDSLNAHQVTPKSVAHTAVSLLSDIAAQVHESTPYIGTAVLLLLKQCSDVVLTDAVNKKDGGAVRGTGLHYFPVLEGVLQALGDHPFPLTDHAATNLGDELHKLFQAKYALPIAAYALVLRATTTLLAAHPTVYTSERLKYLFEHEFMRVGFGYPQLPTPAPSQSGSTTPGRRPSIHQTVHSAEAAQSSILVQTINLGVLVGLIATSHSTHDFSANCTAEEEMKIKEQALHKLKLLLDQLLNVQLVEAPVAPQSAAVSNALMSPPTPAAGSGSVPTPTSLVVIGCVEAARAILNGVMELANKYGSDGQSIPNIVEAIRSIVLSSRRLSKHPKEKQLRYYLTISLSKIFKLELMQLQGHSSSGTSMVHSASTQNIHAAADMGSRVRAVTEHFPPSREPMSPVKEYTGNRLVRSGSSNVLNNITSPAAHGSFTNSFTRSFVNSLLAQLYKEDVQTHSQTDPTSSQLYQRILVLLLDLVALIDYAPLTQLVLPPMIARLNARPSFMHLIISQLTEIALTEERRYAAKNDAREAGSVKTAIGGLSSDLTIFDGILNLFLQSYAGSPVMTVDVASNASSASSRKTTIELPSALLRMATEIKASALKRHLLKRILRLTLDLATNVRSDELALAQHMAEQAKRQKKGQAPTAQPSNLSGISREACGFLLPVLASLMKDCYQEQVSSLPRTNVGQSSPIGLQLYSTPESNVKWFRRLWFFLTSFHFTDALVSGLATGVVAGVSDTWSESVRILAVYSPLLINKDSFADVLSTELMKEYDIAPRRAEIILSTTVNNSSDLNSAALEKIRNKINSALVADYRKQLTALFPSSLAYDISQLPIGRVLFLISFVHLETIRMKGSCGSASVSNWDFSNSSVGSNQSPLSGGFSALFAYLGHYPLRCMELTKYVFSFGDGSAYPLIERLVFTEETCPARQQETEACMLFLIRMLASRIPLQRTTALHFLQQLTRAHVHLQWNTQCLSTLLELLQIVHESLETSVALDVQQHMRSLGNGGMNASATATAFNELMLLKQQLDMPDDLVQRSEIKDALMQLATSWLESAKQHVPEQASLVVQEFIQRVQRNLPRHTSRRHAWHSSLNMLLRASGVAVSTSNGGNDLLHAWSLDALPSIIGGLNVKERYLGEIKGLYRSYQEATEQKRRLWAEERLTPRNVNNDKKPNFANLRSMSILIQEESAVAFQNLLARHTRGAAAAAAENSTSQRGSDIGPQIPPFGRLLTAKLISEGNQILQSFHSIHALHATEVSAQAEEAARAEKEEKLSALHARFERLLCLTAALLIWSTHTCEARPDLDVSIDRQDLLHLVVKAPSQLFTAESLETSVFVWEWILHAHPSFELPLMIEMKAAWGYTVDRQVGLFSHRRQVKAKETRDQKQLPLAQQGAPESSTLQASPSPASSIHTNDAADPTVHANAHAIVVESGADGLRTGMAPEFVRPSAVQEGGGAAGGEAASSAEISNPYGLQSGAQLQSDLSATDVIQPHLTWINFLLSHFRYLHAFSRDCINILASILHKSFARPDLLSSSEKSFGCRFRLLYLGIKLVQSSNEAGAGSGGSFLDLRDKQLLRDRIYAAALAWFHTQPSWYDPSTPQQLREDVQLIIDFCTCLQNEDRYWTEGGREIKLPAEEDASYPLPAPGTRVPPNPNAAKNRIAELQKQRNLLVFLLSHELDRIYTWHSPLSSSSALPPVGSFTTRRSMYAPEWRSIIGTAWSLSPKLCVRLCQRFQQNSIVLSEITRLVQASPSLVYDLPEAVVFLVNEEALKLAASEKASHTEASTSVLRHLIYWTPATLPVAIWFLCAPFCHNRFVLEYAVHSLRSHPPENVMFYLSQILQCLRNDSEDQLLYRFLREASKASILLAHQLLWFAGAELGEVKAETKYVETPFRKQCERLCADVISRFDSVERTFYQQEFEFFEQITAISGILKPLPTKAERKEKIRQELEKIVRPSDHIYLPTNPQLQVVDIICTSGAPMQSAAKVPILVAFKVRVGELDLSNERAAQRARHARAASATLTQGNTSKRLQLRLTSDVVDHESEEKNASYDADADWDADGHNSDKRVAIHVNGVQPVRNNNTVPNGVDAAMAAEVEASRLEAEQIDLMVDPELSESTGGITQQFNTGMAREKASKLAAAKRTADAEGVLVAACIFKVGDDVSAYYYTLQICSYFHVICRNSY